MSNRPVALSPSRRSNGPRMPTRRSPRHAVTWVFPRHDHRQGHTRQVVSNEAVPLPGKLPGASAEPAYRYLSPHQAAVLDAATRRLNLAPRDEPDEHRVIIYVDRL